MIVCTECGHGNEVDDAFCGSCGTFLEFSGQAIASDAPAVEPETEEPSPLDEDRGVVGRIKTAVRLAGRADDEADEEVAAVTAVAEAQAEVDAATERARREAEIARAKAADEAEARRKAEKAAADAAAEADEVRARAEAEAAALRKAEETARAQAAAEAAEARAAADAEADRLRAEAEASRVKAEQAAVQAAAREAEARAESEAESARLRAEAEESRRRAEAAIAEAEERAAENKRRAEEEAARARAEVEAARAEAEAAKAAAEAEVKAREAAEAAEAAARRAAEEARLRTETEAAAREAAEAAAEHARQEEQKRKAELEERAKVMVVAAVVEPVEETPDPHLGPIKPVKETRKRKRSRATVPVVTREAKPGDLICGECGEPNDDTRKFCRRCGSSLVEAEVVPTPWWRKLVTRKRKVVAAGERPGRPGRDGATGRGAVRSARHGWRRFLSIRGRLRALLGLLALLGLATVTIGPMSGVGQDAWLRVRRVIKPTYEAVRPVAATASSSAPGRDPMWLIDGIRNSFWADGVDGPGIGESITITFAEPTDIDRIGITPGATETPEQFIAQPRPRELHIVFEGDEVRSDDITVADSSDFQDFDVGGRGVTRVVIEIRAAHLGTEGHDLAIAELEFYVKE